MDSFNTISETIGTATIFFGKKGPDHVQYPPGINNIEAGLQILNMGYHLNHRKAGKLLFDPATGLIRDGIGSYNFEKMADKKERMTCNNPYPCDFNRGLIEAMSKRFKPAGSILKVTHDDTLPCRKRRG